MLSWRSPNVDEMVLATFAEKGLLLLKEERMGGCYASLALSLTARPSSGWSLT